MANPLENLTRSHDFFVGIDSDGCAFDSMEIKQKECFCPQFIKHFGLQAVSKYARETWTFVNLYSKSRGVNRFPAIVEALDLLRERPEVVMRRVDVPKLDSLRRWIERESKLSNSTLQREIEKTGDPELERVMAYSNAANAAVEDIVKGVPPFPYVRESLEKLRENADIVVVSQTPTEALVREWQEHDIARYALLIAGQELGSKSEHLKMAAVDKYASDHILMVGDAPGDLKAARAAGALFFPVLPGREEESWERFHEDAMERFFSLSYKGDYEAKLLSEFEASLPATPPWK
ncbi:HAD family hydrolase [Salinispira pacifica]